jgi:hypothetical protein
MMAGDRTKSADSPKPNAEVEEIRPTPDPGPKRKDMGDERTAIDVTGQPGLAGQHGAPKIDLPEE